MEDDKNGFKLGSERTSITPDSPNKLTRRSSMKHHRSSIKEPGMVKFPGDKTTLKRKITWTSEVDEEEDPKTPDSKYRDSKTFYSDTSVKIDINLRIFNYI
jgi:hypothetical protein